MVVLEGLSYKVGFYGIRGTLVSSGASDRDGFIGRERYGMSSELRGARKGAISQYQC